MIILKKVNGLYLKFFLFLIFMSGCQKEMTHEKRQKLNDIPVTVSKEEPTRRFVKYDKEIFELNKQIESGERVRVTQAFEKIQKYLMEGSNDSEIYSNPKYLGFLNLYSKALKKWRAKKLFSNKQDHKSQYKNIESSFYSFKKIFVDKCLDPKEKSCDLARIVLRKESTSLDILKYYIDSEKNSFLKLRLITFIFDIANRRIPEAVYYLNIETFLDVLILNENTRQDEVEDQIDLIHVVNLIKSLNFDQFSKKKEKIILRIEPWKFSKVNFENKYLNELRMETQKYVGVYLSKSPVLKEKFEAHISKQIETFFDDKYNLADYPAYKHLTLQTNSKDDLYLFYILTYLQQGQLTVSQAQNFYESIKQENLNLNSKYLFKMAKKLVLWQMAQLSIDTVKRIGEEFFIEKAKSPESLERILGNTRKFESNWYDFHTLKVSPIKSFLTVLYNSFGGSWKKESDDFFKSIDRNIYKTVVYPSMLGMIFYVSQKEGWNKSIVILDDKFTINSRSIVDEFFTAHKLMPWFNFTSSSQAVIFEGLDRTTLFASDMMESYYYFLSTKAYEAFKIKIDDLNTQILKSFLKTRMGKYEKLMDFQHDSYFKNNNLESNFVRWCQALDDPKREVDEEIHFYNLYKFITPFGQLFKNESGLKTFFHDKPTTYISPTEQLDRFRIEMDHIIELVRQLNSVVERFSFNEKLNLQLNQSQKDLEKLEEFKKIYLGMQMSLAERFGGCSSKANVEVRKRIMKVGAYEREYSEKFIYPLMKQIKEGIISLEEANRLLKSVNGNQEGFYDHFLQERESDILTYRVSFQGFILRVAQYLTQGLVINNTITSNFSLDPIVGKHLRVIKPPQYIKDKDNPYTKTGATTLFSSLFRSTQYNFARDGKHFSDNIVLQLTDKVSGYERIKRFTSWNFDGGSSFQELNHKEIEFYYLIHRLGSFEYYDFNHHLCPNKNELNSECVKLRESNFDDIAKKMKEFFDLASIDQNEQEYLELIGEYTFLRIIYSIDLILRLDVNSEYNSGENRYPYQRLNNFFDPVLDFYKYDLVGSQYVSDFTSFALKNMGTTSSNLAKPSCLNMRNIGCYLKDGEKARVENFFRARYKRSHILFPIDKELLKDQFYYYKKLIKDKSDGVLTLLDDGLDLMEKVGFQQKKPILFHLKKEEQILEPYSHKYDFFRGRYQRFYEEVTEGVFEKEEPDLKEYLKFTVN